jgi:hypothetical protein
MHAAGSPDNPMSAAEYEAKFAANAARVLDASRIEALLARVRALPSVTSMADVATLYA